MRIVADTNTVFPGLLWAGPPRRLLDRARERTLTLCTSATLLAEFAEVIAREKFVQRVQAAGLSAAELVQDYERLAEIVEPLPAPVCRDPARAPRPAAARISRASTVRSHRRGYVPCAMVTSAGLGLRVDQLKHQPSGLNLHVHVRTDGKPASSNQRPCRRRNGIRDGIRNGTSDSGCR